ncbi:MAG TPA: hypothetical protein VMY43_13245 [Methanothrix sp.]|nr:hypothetical protein [Methanothrix sp.]
MDLSRLKDIALSLDKAADLPGYRNKWDMLMQLAEKGVPLDPQRMQKRIF